MDVRSIAHAAWRPVGARPAVASRDIGPRRMNSGLRASGRSSASADE